LLTVEPLKCDSLFGNKLMRRETTSVMVNDGNVGSVP